MQQRRHANASGFNFSAQPYTFLCKVSQFDFDCFGALIDAISRMVVVEAVNSNVQRVERSVPLVVAKRFDFYPWSNGTNLVYKRGPALIFNHQTNSNLAQKFEVALKHLEYSPKLINLSKTKETLQNG
jgi:hypothetical protein